MEKQIINEFFSDIREFKNKVLAKTPNKYKLSYIKYENGGTKRFTHERPFFGRNLDKVIFNNKVYYKNRAKFENIYISLDEGESATNLLWLDDIKPQNFNAEQIKYMTLIETSPNNYQAYILLDKNINRAELLKLKKYFVKKYGADKASVDFTHLMRLPFFYSYKHATPHYIIITRWQEKLLNPDLILNKIKNDEPRKYNINIYNVNIDINMLAELYKKYRKEKEKEYKNNIDESVVDYRFFNFVIQHLKYNISAEDAYKIIFDISERKKGHELDYISRTLNNAKINNKNNDAELLYKLIK
jgi:hypothetical protein